MRILIGISNRHVHLTKEDFTVLFGNVEMENVKSLIQTGQFVSNLKVAIKTEKDVINNVRVLGPIRPNTTVEISKTDSFKLGVTPPVRDSADLNGAATVTIVGPVGEVTKSCCIIANRHLHINKQLREELGLTGVEKVSMWLDTEKSALVKDVYVKETPEGVLELHLDTDDGNACLINTGDFATLVKD